MSSPKGEEALTSAFGGILQQYGTSVPQISVVVAILIGSLTLDQYFNAAAWTTIAVLSFSTVYLFRRQIPRSLPKTSFNVAIFLLVTATPVIYLWWKLGLSDFVVQ